MSYGYEQPTRNWVRYDDESYEPVNEDENIRDKYRGPDQQGWTVAQRDADWRPDAYPNTRRGRQGQQEFGTRTQPKGVSSANQSPLAPSFAPQKATTWGQSNSGTQPDRNKTPAPLFAQNNTDLQPQYRLTGHAVAFEDEDREQGQRTGHPRYDSMRDARALDAAERKQHNARTDVDHRTFRERQREADPKWDNRSAARKIYDGLGKLVDAAPQRFGELADKAPGGIQKALVEGAKGTGQAFKGLGHEYATNKNLQKHTGIALGAGLAPVAAAVAPEVATVTAGAIIRNPDKVASAGMAAGEFAAGLIDPGPPPPTGAGYAGAWTKKAYDEFGKRQKRK